MAAVDLVPGIMAVSLVMIPPIVAMERQSYSGKMNPGVGVPAIPEAIAYHVSRGACCGAGDAAQHYRRGK
jgi:hypothetical protein